jgi:hypothetical protein
VLAYINGVQPLMNVFDALIPVICAGSASDFAADMAHPDSAAGNTSHSRSIRTLVREDLGVPVLALNTQTEALFYARQRQDDTAIFRSWEIAGAAHNAKRMNLFSRQKTDRDGMSNSLNEWSATRISEVDWIYVFDAALFHVHNWINGGAPPPRARPIEISADGRDYVYDADGNVQGGVRLPEVEVPAARYVVGPSYPLGGYTVPLSPARLKELYPTREDYAAKISRAANDAKDAGFILPLRVEEYIKAAAIAPVPEELVIETRTQIRANPEGRTSR